MADINSENTGEAKDTGAQLSERQQLLTSGAVAESLGRKLMRLRQDRGLSQRELARRAEMTNSTLSMIEQGKVSPSVASLERILSAIPISLEAFFSNSTAQVGVYKEQELARVDLPGSTILMLGLSETTLAGCYLAKQVIQPGASVTINWLRRSGVIAAMVAKGEVKVTIDADVHLLRKGDCLHFNLRRSHSILNPGTMPAELICSSLPE
ncbi:helix-turn-helix domain-containing protein [Saccharophagus degradans]|uniref:Helix-turn-helix domain-containing protein n=1 Tax=Saccharophagus degradans TaxID=86304 RepID=A0AAW7X2K4_9GAMM|nr:helix-turn-helix domain-containing protein [Saccharophagus degradans]MDO6421720.1 helix-turn-helix domain-containing protein [Saccharophagus degradans]MDO6606586.1 helix-turn-helix domain-containing protein [Saccharophagus degradans]